MNTRTALLTFVALLALSLLTFSLSFAPLGSAAVPVALAIAATKAWLIAMFFMHLSDGAFSNRAVLLVGLLLAILLIGFAGLDVATRHS
jgi:cytochrome c oxidase subunit 4